MSEPDFMVQSSAIDPNFYGIVSRPPALLSAQDVLLYTPHSGFYRCISKIVPSRLKMKNLAAFAMAMKFCAKRFILSDQEVRRPIS